MEELSLEATFVLAWISTSLGLSFNVWRTYGKSEPKLNDQIFNVILNGAITLMIAYAFIRLRG